MNVSLETVRQIYAQGRNYINYGLGVATTLGVISVSQDKGLADSINDMVNGAVQFYHGAASFWQIATVLAAPLITIFLAKKAGNAAKTTSQAAAIAETGAVVVAPPEIANAVPSANVVSNTEVKVVPK